MEYPAWERRSISLGGERVVESKTTTVGLIGDDVVVLAADKRATAGYYIAHKNVRKIAEVTDRIAVTVSGVVADAQAIVDILRGEAKYYELVNGKPASLNTVSSIAQNILFAYSKFYPYIVQLIIAGYDTEPRIYVLDPYGSTLAEKYIATGSGSPIAMGVLETEYRPGMGEEELVKLAVKAVSAALKRDSASGEGIDVVSISKSGIRWYDTFRPSA